MGIYYADNNPHNICQPWPNLCNNILAFVWGIISFFIVLDHAFKSDARTEETTRDKLSRLRWYCMYESLLNATIVVFFPCFFLILCMSLWWYNKPMMTGGEEGRNVGACYYNDSSYYYYLMYACLFHVLERVLISCVYISSSLSSSSSSFSSV